MTNEEAVGSIVRRIKSFAEDGVTHGVPCYISWFNNLFGKFRDGCVYYLGAGPGDGKTTFGHNQQSAWHQQGISSLCVQIEMPKEEYVMAMTAGIANVSAFALESYEHVMKKESHDIRMGGFESAGRVVSSPEFKQYIVDDRAELQDIIATITYHVVSLGVKVVIVDYLQIVSVKGLKGSMKERMDFVTYAFRDLAKRLMVPIIVNSQLTREQRKSGLEPAMHDLKESGSIEETASGVMFLFKKDGAHFGKVDKNRYGIPFKTFPLTFDGGRHRLGDFNNGWEDDIGRRKSGQSNPVSGGYR